MNITQLRGTRETLASILAPVARPEAISRVITHRCRRCGAGLGLYEQCRCGRPPKRGKPVLPRRERGYRSAATKLGISVEEYRDHREVGERWCTGCRAWHPTAAFKRGCNVCRSYRNDRLSPVVHQPSWTPGPNFPEHGRTRQPGGA